MARRRFFVDEVHSGHARIAGDEAHHLTRVLRVEAGQKFEISDGRDVYLAEIEAARKELVTFSILERLPPEETAARIHLLASLIRFERFEDLLEKATELGVESVTPVQAERSEKGLDRAASKRMARWRRIAREASEQARRSHLPELREPAPFASAVEVEAPHRLFLEENDGAPPLLNALRDGPPQSTDVAALLVGPEGGWTDRERALAQERGWKPVSLGPLILRAETAAMAAIAALNAAFYAKNTLKTT